MSLEVVAAQTDPRLRPLVSAFVGYRDRTNGPSANDEVPHPGVTVVVNLGPALRVDGTPFGSFAAGLYERSVRTEHPGEQAGVQLYLAPPAARMLLGLPLGELRHVTAPLGDVLGAPAQLLAERLDALPGWPERFAVVQALLARRLADAAPPHPALVHAWRRIVASGGNVRVERLATEVGWSRRHLAARFGAELGLAPKAFARVVRFDRAVGALRAGGEPGLAAIAARAGFADQPHLNREFRALAGMTPGELVARGFPDVQDAGAGRA